MHLARNEFYNNFTSNSLDEELNNNENRDPNPMTHIYKNTWAIVAGSGSGKTTFLLNCIMQGAFDPAEIFLFAPYETLESGTWKEFLKRDKKKLFTIFDLNESQKLPSFEVLKRRREQYEQFAKHKKIKPKKFLFIFDDYVGLKSKPVNNLVYRLLTQISRLSGDLMLLMQDMDNMPPSHSQNVTVWVIFIHYLSPTQFMMLMRNRIYTGLSKEQLLEFLEFIDNDDTHIHNPIIIVPTCPKKERLNYNGWYYYWDKDKKMIKEQNEFKLKN